LKDFNVVIAGVGGQGSILSSHILGDAAIRDGYHVRVAETYGAAMRGGAVMGQIRIGPNVQEPLILQDKADALVALEPLEGLRRGIRYISPLGLAILNTRRLSPVDANLGGVKYPSIDQIVEKLGKLCREVITIDGNTLAERAGNAKTLNVVMIGALKGFDLLPICEKSLEKAIVERAPPGTQDMNLKAFKLGIEVTRARVSSTRVVANRDA
jgi:indolepyruvate ferredoxin oxidoreductase beta subunit